MKRRRLLDVVEAATSWPSAEVPYVNLDHAATTPPAQTVLDAVQGIIGIYGSIHRGAGIQSRLSTELYEAAFRVVREFVGADADDVVAVSSNTTTAVNRLARALEFDDRSTVLVSEIEHSSNVLPWRKHARVATFQSSADGRVDLGALEEELQRHEGGVRLVAVTGASNVTGYLPPISDVARLAHQYGAEVFVDAAQLAPHRQIRMRTTSADRDLDYVALTGHKMYAPFGVSLLVGRRKPFEVIPPDLPGGGTVEMVTEGGQIWSALPARITPGTPNVVGLVAIASAMHAIQKIGYETIRLHEGELVSLGTHVLRAVPGVDLHGQSAFRSGEDRLPLFPFTIDGLKHAKVAAILGHEYGIGVRSGHLCQYEFMRRQLGVSEGRQQVIESDLERGDRRNVYGMVRASCGLCTSAEDLEALGIALSEISRHGTRRKYRHDRSSGMFTPLDGEGGFHLVPQALRFLLPPTASTCRDESSRPHRSTDDERTS